jgi:hypothetical protein
MKLSLILLLTLLGVTLALPDRILKRGKGKGKGGSKKLKKLLAKLEEMCSVLEVYDNVIRFNRNKTVPFMWQEACDEMESVDQLLCPSYDVVQDICAHPNPQWNPAVRHNYCEPLFEPLEDEDRKAKCTHYCINYVSIDRGGCCDFYCDV